MTHSTFDIRYDRSVSDEFLELFLPDGVAGSLAPMARDAAYPLDLHMRKDPKTKREWATVYAGLTAVLNVNARPHGRLRLTAHKTHSEDRRYGFRKAWSAEDMTPGELAAAWPEVELYLERVIPPAVKNHGVTEGAVQAAVSKSTTSPWIMIDREVAPSFRDQKFKDRVMHECWEPLVAALPKDLKAGVVPKKFGPECDVLALDPARGQLLAVEVKPYNGAGIAWVAAQATMYAMLLSRWIELDKCASSIVDRMIDQRHELFPATAPSPHADLAAGVVPVVALQRGASELNKKRMLAVRDALPFDALGVPPVEIFEVSITGDLNELL